MPRHDGNTHRTPRRHHKRMKSGHKGRGADKRKKAEKQVLGQASHSPKSEKRKKKPDRLEYEPA
jgi:hypothetical protein